MSMEVCTADSTNGACRAKGDRPVTLEAPFEFLPNFKPYKVTLTQASVSYSAKTAAVMLHLGEVCHAVAIHDSKEDVLLVAIVGSEKKLTRFFTRNWNLRNTLDRLRKNTRVKGLYTYDWDTKSWMPVPQAAKSLGKIIYRLKKGETFGEVMRGCYKGIKASA